MRIAILLIGSVITIITVVAAAPNFDDCGPRCPVSVTSTPTPTPTATPTNSPINFTGFESGATDTDATSSLTPTITSVDQRTGGYALSFSLAKADAGYWCFGGYGATGQPFPFSLTSLYVRAYFFGLSSIGSDETIMYLRNNSAVAGEIRWGSDGPLAFYDFGGNLVATGVTTLNAGQWYLIESHWNEVAQTLEVRVDGSVELDVSGADLGSSAFTQACFGRDVANGSAVDFFYDDILIDAGYWPGPGRIKAMVPDGTASIGDFTVGTGSTFAEVDEIPSDSDATYIRNDKFSSTARFDLKSTSIAGISGTVHSVKSWARVREDVAATTAAKTMIRSGATDASNASALDGTTSYADISQVVNADPADSLPWTLADLDSLQAGVIEGAVARIRCSTVTVFVDYEP